MPFNNINGFTSTPSDYGESSGGDLVNIFIRLLAKKLAQMRSDSKSWNALLSQPSFVKSHLHRSIHNHRDQTLLVFYYRESLTHAQHTPVDLPMSNIIISSNS